MSTSAQEIENLIAQDYKQGFVTEIEVETFPPGLDEEVIAKLSKIKNEPDFMLEYRLKAFRHWQTMKEPNWAQLNIEPIDYQSISYYSAPKKKGDGPQIKSWVFLWMNRNGWPVLQWMRCLIVFLSRPPSKAS